MKKIKGLFGGKDKSKKQDTAKNEPEIAANSEKADSQKSQVISTPKKEGFTIKNVEEIKIQQIANDQDDGFQSRKPAQSEIMFRSQREIVKPDGQLNDDLFATLPSATQNRARMTTNFMDSFFENEDEEEDDHNEDMFLNRPQRDRFGNQMNLDLLSRSVQNYDYFGKEDLKGEQSKQKDVDQKLTNSQIIIEPVSQQLKNEKVIERTQFQVINDPPQKIEKIDKIIEKADIEVKNKIITDEKNKNELSQQFKTSLDQDLPNIVDKKIEIQQTSLVSQKLSTQEVQTTQNIVKPIIDLKPELISQSKQALDLPQQTPQQQTLKPVIPPVNIPTFKPVVFPPVKPVIIPPKAIISNQTVNNPKAENELQNVIQDVQKQSKENDLQQQQKTQVSDTNLTNNQLDQIIINKSISESQTIKEPLQTQKDDLYSKSQNISIETQIDIDKVGPPELFQNSSQQQQDLNINSQNQKITPQIQMSSTSNIEPTIQDTLQSQQIILESKIIPKIQVAAIPQQIQNQEPFQQEDKVVSQQIFNPQLEQIQISENKSTIELLPTQIQILGKASSEIRTDHQSIKEEYQLIKKTTQSPKSIANDEKQQNKTTNKPIMEFIQENDFFQTLPRSTNQYRMSTAITERGQNDLLIQQNIVGEEKNQSKANSRLSVRPAAKNSVLERIKEKRQGQVRPTVDQNDFKKFTENDEPQQNSQIQTKTIQQQQFQATTVQQNQIQATTIQQQQIQATTVQQQQIQTASIQQNQIQATSIQQEQLQRKTEQQQIQTKTLQVGLNDSQKYNFNPNGSIIKPPIKKQPVQDILLEEIQENFMDFTIKRNEIQTQEIKKIQTIQMKNEIQPQKIIQEEIKIEEIKIEEAVFSSDSELTDQNFEDNISIDSDEVDLQMQKAASKKMALELMEQEQKDQQVRSIEFITDFDNDVKLANADIEAKLDEEEDFMKLVTNNENMYRSFAEKKLREQRKNSMSTSKSLNQLKENSSTQSVVSEPNLMKQICKNFGAPNIKATCIALNPELILVGTSAGILFGYNKDNEQPFGINKQDSKEFIDNAITCIDIHSRRPEYCIIGYAKGQLALINLKEMKKTIKLIKDHHKRPIVSVKFCDWIKEKPHLKLGPDHSCKECQNVQSWMFISCDTDGKVVQNIVENVGLGLMIANNTNFIDPNISYTESIYQVLATRMSNQYKPMGLPIDSTTLVAIGCSENVLIFITLEKQKIDKLIINKPKRYLSQNTNSLMPIMSQLPILSWGFGKSPKNNFKNYPILAIAWGPLIQLVVLKEIGNKDFDIDGYYIIAASQEKNKDGFDLWVQSLHWLDDSLLIAVTSNNEIRVMITEKFHESEFNDPNQSDVNQIQRMDIRKKMMPFGHTFSEQQLEIELERKCFLSHQFVQSYYGLTASQTHIVFEDKILSLTNNGIYQMHHLNWLENLGNLENQLEQGQWTEIFGKALEIYLGNIKGLRMIKGIGQMHLDNMKDQLKGMIDKQVLRIINSWKTRADQNQKIGFLQMQDVLNFKFQTLIRIVIEFCVEIQEPTFLFDTLLKKFQIQGKSKLFADELKPYILSGHFQECVISESILKDQILQYFINDYQDSYDLIKSAKTGENVASAISPVENIEKIFLNFKFDKCSKEYQFYLIEFCKKHSLTSALIYLCLSSFGEQGPFEAITQLKDFYQNTIKNEAYNQGPQISRADLHQLNNLPATWVDRILLERSSAYLGIKLLWLTRQFLLGRKFIHGTFSTSDWHILCHDILDVATQDDFIGLCCEIDAAAYFQIISIVFTNPSIQFSFIEHGRPGITVKQKSQTEPQIIEKISISHDLIVKRISNYFYDQGQNHPSHLHYLCFIASIASTQEKKIANEQDEKLYYYVLLELIKHSDLLVGFNKDLLNRRMTNNQMYKRFSKTGNLGSEEQKHLILSESMLLVLIERCKTILQDQKHLDQLLQVVEQTEFQSVKLMLYELNKDYIKCLKFFMISAIKAGLKGGSSQQIGKAMTFKGFMDGFTWIEENHSKLKSLKLQESDIDLKENNQLQIFEKEVLNQIVFLVKCDVKRTIRMCDKIFKAAHNEILDQLKNDQRLQLYYIQNLLDLKLNDIKDIITSSGQFVQGSRANAGAENLKWMNLLSQHVRLVCIYEPENVTKTIKKIVKDNFYPIEDCLKICKEFKQTEATALLYKKIGNHSMAVSIYLMMLQEGLDYNRFKKELFYLNKENKRHNEKHKQIMIKNNQALLLQQIQSSNLSLGKVLSQLLVVTAKNNNNLDKILMWERKDNLYKVWTDKFGVNIVLLDHVMEKLMKMCKNHPKELLMESDETWTKILSTLFQIQLNSNIKNKSYCKRHLKQKMVSFCRIILPYISFSRIIFQLSTFAKNLKFKAVKELVSDVFSDKSQEFEMCINADTTLGRDLLQFWGQVNENKSKGVPFQNQSLNCGICKKKINRYGLQTMVGMMNTVDEWKVFDCVQNGRSKFNHSFHLRCLKVVIQEEQEKDRQNKKTVTSEIQIDQYLRCSKCYPKPQDFTLNDNIVQKTKVGLEFQEKDYYDDSNQSDVEQRLKIERQQSSDSNKKDDLVMKLKNRAAAMHIIQKKHTEKQMKRFDEQILHSGTLYLSDFKLSQY